MTAPDLDCFRVPPRPEGINLDGFATDDPRWCSNRSSAERSLRRDVLPKLAPAHRRLMAHAEHSVLLVLQGLDGSGKSGTIRHVLGGLDPVGVRVVSFKAPTAAERREPFLARIERAVPDPGQLAVFDRSHYEDIIVPGADDSDTVRLFNKRVAAITSFEERLADRGVIVVKVWLHLSYDEQRERFRGRLSKRSKQWKFSDADLDTRERWAEFVASAGRAIGATSADQTPWYVIPADQKWRRNWLVAHLLLSRIAQLHDDWPIFDGDPEALLARLQPPN